MNKKKLKAAFSLIEVILALGILGSVLLVIIALLPKTLTQTQSLRQQETLNNLLPSITAELKASQLAPKCPLDLYCWQTKTGLGPQLDSNPKALMQDFEDNKVQLPLFLQLTPLKKDTPAAKTLLSTNIHPVALEIYALDLTLTTTPPKDSIPLITRTLLLKTQ